MLLLSNLCVTVAAIKNVSKMVEISIFPIRSGKCQVTKFMLLPAPVTFEVKMTRKEKRNELMRKEIADLRTIGYTAKQAIKLVAERYFLHWTTVRDIIYRRR